MHHFIRMTDFQKVKRRRGTAIDEDEDEDEDED